MSFAEAKEITRVWLAANQPGAALTGAGREDSEYWDVGWDCPLDDLRFGPPLTLVNKTTGDLGYFLPQIDPSILDRIEAMTPVAARDGLYAR